MAFAGFGKDFFGFLRDLAAHNDRAWFEANKQRYRDTVVAPVSAFITALAPKLRKVSPQFVADPRPVGGSMFRIHRDTRFAKDKSPYKTHTGVQFRHAAGKDAHAPGFYLHLEPRRVFYGGGVWMPAPTLLGAVRQRIADEPAAWRKALSAPSLVETFGGLAPGDPLLRPPRGFDPAHPHIEDIKKRSFFLMVEATEADAGKPAFLHDVAEAYLAARPVMRFLTAASGHPF
ncbi:MAG: DUF2461 domain-containing protein [Hyphomonadaceae bacterium]|nr:DUF2461 domain-containing protein [Hyphomonadaceae bacterium]